jgi:hypothetical protein
MPSTITYVIKRAHHRVFVQDVEHFFNRMFQEKLVVEVVENVKIDRFTGRPFKMFFVTCDQTSQKLGHLDRFTYKLTKEGGMTKVIIDEMDHYWKVAFSKVTYTPEKVASPQVDYKKERDSANAAIQMVLASESYTRTRKESDCSGKIFEIELAKDDPLIREALEDAARRFWPYQVLDGVCGSSYGIPR